MDVNTMRQDLRTDGSLAHFGKTLNCMIVQVMRAWFQDTAGSCTWDFILLCSVRVDSLLDISICGRAISFISILADIPHRDKRVQAVHHHLT